MCQDALDVYNELPFETEEGRTDMNTMLTLMEKHCVGETNVIYERYVFKNHIQETHETVDAYATAPRSLAKSCDFGSLKDDSRQNCMWHTRKRYEKATAARVITHSK